ncbi:MAG: hypothetical protein AAF797_11095 [Planctomycetota bacterium]
MRRSRTTVVALIAFGTVLACGFPLHTTYAEDADPIAGSYTVQGSMGDGKTYNAGAAITKIGDAYVVVWDFGNEQVTAIGVFQDGYLAVGYPQGEQTVVVLYRLEGKNLVGRWTSLGMNGTIHTETFTRIE